jgi:hypothetical protein
MNGAVDLSMYPPLNRFLAMLIRHLGKIHNRHNWEQLMLIENNKILRMIAETSQINVTMIPSIGTAHPPPPALPTLHMPPSPGLGVSSLALDDTRSNTSSHSNAKKSEELGKPNISNADITLINIQLISSTRPVDKARFHPNDLVVGLRRVSRCAAKPPIYVYVCTNAAMPIMCK